MTTSTILFFILIVLLVGAFPSWPLGLWSERYNESISDCIITNRSYLSEQLYRSTESQWARYGFLVLKR
ncbi:DUF3309 family protein [Methylophaga nitratireducenticrescens]|uniref:DUF3309 family protein n=1 Tax=Methylophaga nitratireducenticrescens TaxID=754476 RepID=UPI0026D6F4E0